MIRKQLIEIIKDDLRPIFVATIADKVVGYAFCVHKQFVNDNNMTDVKTLYIDDLCVDENARGKHVGKALYEYVVDYEGKTDIITLRSTFGRITSKLSGFTKNWA